MIPYSYTNWMGVEIHVGDLVFYSTGGSYPDFRIGQVLDFKMSGGYGRKEALAKVHWLFERGYQHEDDNQNFRIPFAVDKKSTISAEVLCPVADDMTDVIANHKHRLDSMKNIVV